MSRTPTIWIACSPRLSGRRGKLDIVFATAGIPMLTPLDKITEEEYDSIFKVNVKSVLFTVQKALPLMADGASSILNAFIVAK